MKFAKIKSFSMFWITLTLNCKAYSNAYRRKTISDEVKVIFLNLCFKKHLYASKEIDYFQIMLQVLVRVFSWCLAYNNDLSVKLEQTFTNRDDNICCVEILQTEMISKTNNRIRS